MTLGDRICVMYDGKIQQVAEPMEVYDKPVNRFVAGFLGTTPMNFFDGHVELLNSKLSIACGNDKIMVRDSTANKLLTYRGKKIVLGIRPEHLSTEPIPGQR